MSDLDPAIRCSLNAVRPRRNRTMVNSSALHGWSMSTRAIGMLEAVARCYGGWIDPHGIGNRASNRQRKPMARPWLDLGELPGLWMAQGGRRESDRHGVEG